MRKFLLFLVISITTSSSHGQTFPDSRTDGKYFIINGAKLWTVKVGSGDPLFIIAGGPGSAHYKMRTFDSLYATSTIVYFDAFGRGKSDIAKDMNEYTINRDISDLEGLRKAMGYEKINVLGHSYGSIVAQGYAIRYPENTKHLILVAPFHSSAMWQENDDNCNREIKTNYPEVWDTLMSLRKRGYVSRDSLHQLIYGRVPYGFLYAFNPDNFNGYSIPYPNGFNIELYYQMVGNDGDFIVESDISKFDCRNELKKLPMPVLILAGRYDRVAVPSMMVKYKEYCPQAQFVMFERSGHNPQIEETDVTMELIRTFLNR